MKKIPKVNLRYDLEDMPKKATGYVKLNDIRVDPKTRNVYVRTNAVVFGNMAALREHHGQVSVAYVWRTKKGKLVLNVEDSDVFYTRVGLDDEASEFINYVRFDKLERIA